jgi:hypothetical protein
MIASPVQILKEILSVQEPKDGAPKEDPSLEEKNEEVKVGDQRPSLASPSKAKYQLQTHKIEILCSKILFFKNYFLSPILVDLIELSPYLFIVRVSFYALEKVQLVSRFFFVHSLMGLFNKSHKANYQQLLVHVIGVFQCIDWDEILITALYINDGTISFTSEINQFNFIRL